MCGICGYIGKNRIPNSVLEKMNDTLSHRGPDDKGIVQFEKDGYYVGFAHRRLSILDLSMAGHQPMKDVTGRYSIVFNGEIYNFIDLKTSLIEKGYSFNSTCDTEVLLYHMIEYGEEGLKTLNGMYDFAFYDGVKNTLLLARDKVGEKPLYYYYNGELLIFGSELKPIMCHPDFSREIRKESIAQYLVHNAVMPPYTIFQNTYKLAGGESLIWKNGEVSRRCYYDIQKEFNEGKKNQDEDYTCCKRKLKDALFSSVSRRLISDVPVGCFLSGGIDSTLVSAIANELKLGGIDTFSIGFEDEQFNEAVYARESSEYLGTKHHQKIMNENDLFEMMDDLVKYYDEPFSDSSQLATMLVAQFAKDNVSVALSGDGGDEFFAGYKKYDGFSMVQKGRKITQGGRILHCKALINLAEAFGWEKIQLLLRENDDCALIQPRELYREGIVNKILLSPIKSKSTLLDFEGISSIENLIERRMVYDMRSYMPDEVLVKTDRASMKYSLEMRTPLLDLDVVNYSFRIPFEYKYKSGIKKYILKDILNDFIPMEMMERPKQGFGVPIRRWLNTTLGKKVMRYTDPRILKKQGIFDYYGIMDLIERVKLRDDFHEYSTLWGFLVFQEWYAEYIDDLWNEL